MTSSIFFGCVVAIAVTGFAVITGLQLSTFNVEAPYLILLPCVVAAVAIGGRISGAVAITLAAVLTWFFFIPPVWSFRLPSVPDTVTFALYLAVMIWICRLYYRQKRTIDELATANHDLRVKLGKLGRADLAL